MATTTNKTNRTGKTNRTANKNTRTTTAKKPLKRITTKQEIYSDRKKEIEKLIDEYDKITVKSVDKMDCKKEYIPILGRTANGLYITQNKELLEALQIEADEHFTMAICNKHTDDEQIAFYVILENEKYYKTFPRDDIEDGAIVSFFINYKKAGKKWTNIEEFIPAEKFEEYAQKAQKILTNCADRIAKREAEIEKARTEKAKEAKKENTKEAKKAVAE